MKISTFRIRNYKSWDDSGELALSHRINVIIGQNNSGKSALLEALSLTAISKPHRSLDTVKRLGSPIPFESKSTFRFYYDQDECYEFVQFVDGGFFVPSSQPDEELAASVIESKLKSSQSILVDFENSQIARIELDAFWGEHNPGFMMVNDLATRVPTMSSGHTRFANVSDLFAWKVAELSRSSIYQLQAERYNVSQSRVIPNYKLSTKAENLAAVLHYLYTDDPLKFQEYVSVVSKVLPQIKSVIPPPTGDANTHIKVWTRTMIQGRSDLSVPLLDSGTGVGQVLSMLYVVVNSDRPQCLVIDEPQSFLHPGAINSLLEVFRQYDHHQYIIATHSPSILKLDAQFILVKNDGTKSSAEIVSAPKSKETRLILESIGASLSDVYGADKILWVEGATEVECFTLLRNQLKLGPFWGVEIAAVRSTGELQGRHAEAIFDIYGTLSRGKTVIPPAVGFVFDRDGRTDEECERISKRCAGKVFFTKRRMFEGYLIHVPSVSYVLSKLNGSEGRQVTEAELTTWVMRNGKKAEYLVKDLVPLSPEWYLKTHGALLLHDLFKEFTNNIEYRKVIHGVMLTERILETAPDELLDIKELLLEALAMGINK